MTACQRLLVMADDPKCRPSLIAYLSAGGFGFPGGTVAELVDHVLAHNLSLLYGGRAQLTLGELAHDMLRDLDDQIAVLEDRIEHYKAQNPAHVHTFTVDDDRFEVPADQLKLKPGVALDYEVEPEVAVKVTARDAENLTVSRQFVITVDDRNDAPDAIGLDNASVMELWAGATVGNLWASDQDPADEHVFQVHDARFELVGNELRLKPDQSLSRAVAGTVTVDVSATDNGSPQQTTHRDLTITVLPNDAPWQNRSDRHDVNRDLSVSPLDVLRIIDDINRNGPHPLAAPPADPRYYPDVNGDNELTPIDVLDVISFINSRVPGEGEADADGVETRTGWPDLPLGHALAGAMGAPGRAEPGAVDPRVVVPLDLAASEPLPSLSVRSRTTEGMWLDGPKGTLAELAEDAARVQRTPTLLESVFAELFHKETDPNPDLSSPPGGFDGASDWRFEQRSCTIW